MRANLEDNNSKRLRTSAIQFGTIETQLTGAYTISPTSGTDKNQGGPVFHFLGTGPTNRDVFLPAISPAGGQFYIISNQGPNNLILRTAAGVVLKTVVPGSGTFCVSSALAWHTLPLSDSGSQGVISVDGPVDSTKLTGFKDSTGLVVRAVTVGSGLSYNSSTSVLTATVSPAGFVAKTGDTMTGTLTIQPPSGVATLSVAGTPGANGAQVIVSKGASGQQNLIAGYTASSPRWVLTLGDTTPEANVADGSNVTLLRYDNSGTAINPPALVVTRSTGLMTVAGNPTDPLGVATKQTVDGKVAKAGDTMTGALGIAPASGNASITLNKPVSGQSDIITAQTNGVNRWNVNIANGTAESGSDVGSDFTIIRFNDAGVSQGAALTIARNTGTISTTGPLNINTTTAGQAFSVGTSALCGFSIQPQAAAQVLLQAIGVDTNIRVAFSTKGTGGYDFYSGGTGFARMQVQINDQTAAGILELSGGDPPSGGSPNIYLNTGSAATGVTPPAASNDRSLATTAFVKTAIAGISDVSTFDVRGLNGVSNSTTVTFTFNEAVLRNLNGGGVLAKNGSLSINTTAAAGANGPDVALPASGDIHFYAIWNGTTLSGLCSVTGSPTGPALPSGYTHWCYLTTIKRTGSSMFSVTVRGDWVTYVQQQTILNNGNSGGSWTSVSTATAVPLNATNVMVLVLGTATASSAGGQLTHHIGWTSGFATFSLAVYSLAIGQAGNSAHALLPNVSQTMWYVFTIGTGTYSASAFSVWVTGYQVPNNS